MVQSPSWEASSSSQEILRILWNPKFSLPLSQQPVRSPFSELCKSSARPPSSFLQDDINVILPSRPRSSKWTISSDLFIKPCLHLFCPPIRATCSAHLILLDLHQPNFIWWKLRSIWWTVQIINILVTYSSPLACYLVPSYAQICATTPYSGIQPAHVLPPPRPPVWETKFQTHANNRQNYSSVYLIFMFLDFFEVSKWHWV